MSDVSTLPATTASEILATGRRKKSVARVRLRPGSGKIQINGRAMEEYFRNEQQRKAVVAPLVQLGKQDQFDIQIRAQGGGFVGQADACKLGIARALKLLDPEFDKPLREAGLLTRDGRMKERKKYGLHGARRGVQFSKR